MSACLSPHTEGITDMELLTLSEASVRNGGPCDWNDYSTHKTLTCVNHQGMRYLTKSPWDRQLHIVTRDPSLPDDKVECDCPFGDLRVIVKGD